MARRWAVYFAPVATLSLVVSLCAEAAAAQGQQRGVGTAARATGAAGASIGRQYALVVGTNEYEARKQWRPLVNPIRDAETIAVELARSFGFDTLVLRNPTAAELAEAFRGLRKRPHGGNDQLLVFIAGHGHLDDLTNSGALVSRDSRPTSEDPRLSTYTDFSRLANIAEAMPTEHVLVILDVCYGGTFSGDIRYAGSRAGDAYDDVAPDEFIRRKLQFRTRQYVTSGGREYVPDGRPGQHSPFAARLIRTLREYAASGKILTLAGLRANIEGLNPQPRAGAFGSDEPGSDFIFAPPTRTLTVTASQGAIAAMAEPKRNVQTPAGAVAEPKRNVQNPAGALADPERDAREAAGNPAPQPTQALSWDRPMAAVPSESDRLAIEADLTWLWNDHSTDRRGPLRLADTAYVVRESPALYRRYNSGRACLLNALIAARRGDPALAIGWLKAGHAHNEAAQQRFDRYQSHVITQLLQLYGATLK